MKTITKTNVKNIYFLSTVKSPETKVFAAKMGLRFSFSHQSLALFCKVLLPASVFGLPAIKKNY
jgi:hypothetical protein